MGLGMSKDFVIMLVVAGGFAYGLKDAWIFVLVMGIYAVIKGTWRLLT